MPVSSTIIVRKHIDNKQAYRKSINGVIAGLQSQGAQNRGEAQQSSKEEQSSLCSFFAYTCRHVINMYRSSDHTIC